jgi:hypothetical protein
VKTNGREKVHGARAKSNRTRAIEIKWTLKTVERYAEHRLIVDGFKIVHKSRRWRWVVNCPRLNQGRKEYNKPRVCKKIKNKNEINSHGLRVRFSFRTQMICFHSNYIVIIVERRIPWSIQCAANQCQSIRRTVIWL